MISSTPTRDLWRTFSIKSILVELLVFVDKYFQNLLAPIFTYPIFPTLINNPGSTINQVSLIILSSQIVSEFFDMGLIITIRILHKFQTF